MLQLHKLLPSLRVPLRRKSIHYVVRKLAEAGELAKAEEALMTALRARSRVESNVCASTFALLLREMHKQERLSDGRRLLAAAATSGVAPNAGLLSLACQVCAASGDAEQEALVLIGAAAADERAAAIERLSKEGASLSDVPATVVQAMRA